MFLSCWDAEGMGPQWRSLDGLHALNYGEWEGKYATPYAVFSCLPTGSVYVLVAFESLS